MTTDRPAANDVRRRRRALDVTQDELARRIGVARQTLNVVERGGTPSLATALRLGRALGAPLDEIFPIHAAEADTWMDKEKSA